MRTISIILGIILAATLAYPVEDMRLYTRKTQQLVKEGKYQEALERHMWFHNHALEHDPSLQGVRLSFALMYWRELGDLYPPALESMKKVRDDKTDLLIQGEGDLQLFHDVTALNRKLEDNNETVELFRHLDKNQKALAKQCWDTAKEAVIITKAYDLARKHIGNLVREFEIAKQKYDRNKAMYGGKNFGEHFKAFNEDNFVKETLRLIELAVSLDENEAAKEIQSSALAIIDDQRLKDALAP